MLSWASRLDIFCFLDNHEYGIPPHSYECLLGAGAVSTLRITAGQSGAFDSLEEFSRGQDDWLFGHFSYDLKNELGPFTSHHPDFIGFPDLLFFVPEIVIELNRDSIRIGVLSSGPEDPGNVAEAILAKILATPFSPLNNPVINRMGPLQARFSREEYIRTVERLREHILRGDCYEINFCQEFFIEEALIDPLTTWLALSEASPSPFGAFYKVDSKYLFCASPERYLHRQSDLLLSQPIKGTWARSLQDPGEDRLNRDLLYHSAKDRSENVMVVDLVRNDLSRVCIPGTVKVEELYGIYSFPQVHQMISTVSGKMVPGTSWVESIRATFPMGSMTGAPKKRVMELVEQYEKTRRGLYSGALGYVSPGGDFDFNVVIRSILYDRDHRYLSYQVGSGITFYSDPVAEYKECLLKAAGIKKALGI